MNSDQIIRAWEDPVYRAGLAPEIVASLPTNPAGASVDELDKAELSDVLGSDMSAFAKNTKGLVCVVTVSIQLSLSIVCKCC